MAGRCGEHQHRGGCVREDLVHHGGIHGHQTLCVAHRNRSGGLARDGSLRTASAHLHDQLGELSRTYRGVGSQRSMSRRDELVEKG